MRILQISDIHTLCYADEYDDYSLMRTRFLDALDVMMKEGKTIQNILVSGDIADKGKLAAYDKARIFLEEVSEKLNDNGTKPEIYVIPGNHDLNRESYTEIRDHLRKKLLGEDGDKNFYKLQHKSPELLRILYAPFKGYNDFAQIYESREEIVEAIMNDDCGGLGAPTLSEKKNYMVREIGKIGEYKVNIFGINTALFCNGEESPVETETTKQCLMLLPRAGYCIPTSSRSINIAMLHHPTDWFIDGSQIQKELDKRFQIQIFGHLHKQSSTKDGVLRIYSGAFQPVGENEESYQPVFNVIEMDVEDGVLKGNLISKRWNINTNVFEDFSEESKPFEIILNKKTGEARKEEIQDIPIMSKPKLPVNEINYKFISSDNYVQIMKELAPDIYRDDRSDTTNISKFLLYVRDNNKYDELLALLEE